jgi:hypothetical protein
MIEAMQENGNRVIINENGAFIPRNLFGQSARILSELQQGGVLPKRDAEPKTRIKRVEPIDLSREIQWLKEHRQEYIGQWVALDGDRLISHGATAREAYAAAREAGVKSPLVEYISPIEDMPFGGW